jgi:hypothetical protein
LGGQVRAEKQTVWGNDAHGGHGDVCERDTAVFRSDKGKPLDGRDQTTVTATWKTIAGTLPSNGSSSSPQNTTVSPSHTGPHVGRFLPQPVSLLAPTLSSSFRLDQVIFKPNMFMYKYPNIFNPSHTSYIPAYEDGTQCSKTLASELVDWYHGYGVTTPCVPRP